MTGALLARELHVQLNVAMANAVPTEASRLRGTRRRVAVERARSFIRNSRASHCGWLICAGTLTCRNDRWNMGFAKCWDFGPWNYIKMLRLAEECGASCWPTV